MHLFKEERKIHTFLFLFHTFYPFPVVTPMEKELRKLLQMWPINVEKKKKLLYIFPSQL